VAAAALDRADVEDAAPVLLAHDRDDALAQNDWRDKVGAELLFHLARAPLEERALRLDGRVVDQDVNTTELADGLIDPAGDGVDVVHVAAQRDRAAAGFTDIFSFGFGGVAIDVLDRDGAPRRRERLRDPQPDPAAGAGEQRRAVRQ